MRLLTTVFALIISLHCALLARQFSSEAIVIMQPDANLIEQFAADELAKHLGVVLNQTIKIVKSGEAVENYVYRFYVGRDFVTGSKALEKEEAVYQIRDSSVYLGGDDSLFGTANSPIDAATNMYNRAGTLSAVYDFLHNELGCRWLEPGDKGIYCKQADALHLHNTYHTWHPAQVFRLFRSDVWQWQKLISNKVDMYQYTPRPLWMSPDDVTLKNREEHLWMRRMKQCVNGKPQYGHAFTDAWKKHGYSHPEWFAVGPDGKRGLRGATTKKKRTTKFCVTNKELQHEIVTSWQRSSFQHLPYNACINDSSGYCRCDECRALDSDFKKHPSNNFESEPKSDRYVYFWNALLQQSRAFNPEAKLIAYAYDAYRYPPRTRHLSEGIILGFVPQFFDTPENIEKTLTGWRLKGMRDVFLRPNDFNDDIGMPMGHEKFIFDKYQVFKNYKLYGIDYDRNYNFVNWNYDGLAYYLLARSINAPELSFETLEKEYFQTFEEAGNDIAAFYHYWRRNFETKRLPVAKEYGGFKGRRNLYKEIGKFYTLDDFDTTDRLLQNALNQVKNPEVHARINRLAIANTHSRLLYMAIRDHNAYKQLLNFRLKHHDALNLCWPTLFHEEHRLIRLESSNPLFILLR